MIVLILPHVFLIFFGVGKDAAQEPIQEVEPMTE